MYVSFRFGSFLRLLAAIAVGAVIVGLLLAQSSTRKPAPADVMPPQVVQTTGSTPLLLPSPHR